jgi:sugar transferase EpsL
MYCQWGKRIFDFLFAAVSLLLLFPLVLLIGLLVRIFLGTPVLFTQIRPGLNEKPFRLYKFRTMLNKVNRQGQLLHEQERLTTFGRFLRSTSLDEIPELINVLKGEMSIVGPRPLLMEYLPHYSDTQRRRHALRPGITGWAQVNGRNTLSWKKKFKLDVWYIDNCSFILDCKIIFTTMAKIIKRDGINAFENVTMTRFDLESQNNNTV